MRIDASMLTSVPCKNLQLADDYSSTSNGAALSVCCEEGRKPRTGGRVRHNGRSLRPHFRTLQPEEQLRLAKAPGALVERPRITDGGHRRSTRPVLGSLT